MKLERLAPRALASALAPILWASPAYAFQSCISLLNGNTVWSQPGSSILLMIAIISTGIAAFASRNSSISDGSRERRGRTSLTTAITAWGTLVWWHFDVTHYGTISCGGHYEMNGEYLTHLLIGGALMFVIAMGIVREVHNIPRSQVSRIIGPLALCCLLLYHNSTPSGYPHASVGGGTSMFSAYESKRTSEIISNPSNFDERREYIIQTGGRTGSTVTQVLIVNGSPNGTVIAEEDYNDRFRRDYIRLTVIGQFLRNRKLDRQGLPPTLFVRDTLRKQYCIEGIGGMMRCASRRQIPSPEESVRYDIINHPTGCKVLDQLLSDPRNAEQVGGRDHFMQVAHCTSEWGYERGDGRYLPNESPPGVREDDFVRHMIASSDSPDAAAQEMRCFRDAYHELARQDGREWSVVHIPGYYVGHYEMQNMCNALRARSNEQVIYRGDAATTPGLDDDRSPVL